MKQDKVPKVFMSYSWSCSDLVLQLAKRLMSNGIDVVLDKWELKEGQDKYAFMERCVNDSEIDRVLIICDEQYVEKANDRKGGVGDETIIISSEIYNKVRQEKFIPVIVECDENGNPFIPTYISSRIYIDLSDDNKYEDEYEKLVRNIYEQPLYKKPKLGSKPEWLNEDKVNLFPLQDLIRQIKNATNINKQKALLNQFKIQHIEILKSFFPDNNVDGKKLCDIWMETKPVRDYYLDWLETLLYIDCNMGEMLCDYFENMYNTLLCIKSFDDTREYIHEFELEIYRIYIWEIFICTIAFFRHYEIYDAINVMLSNTYFLIDSEFENNINPSNYTKFRHYSRLIETYKHTTNMRPYYTLMGHMLCT